MKIHELTAREMRDRLEQGELSSVEIVKALHARADQVEEQVNGFVQQFREEALREARRADEARSRGEVRGPLHGLPLTVKDNIDIQGAASTLGLRSRLAKRADRDAVWPCQRIHGRGPRRGLLYRVGRGRDPRRVRFGQAGGIPDSVR